MIFFEADSSIFELSFIPTASAISETGKSSATRLSVSIVISPRIE